VKIYDRQSSQVLDPRLREDDKLKKVLGTRF